jgi:hypothetical protein
VAAAVTRQLFLFRQLRSLGCDAERILLDELIRTDYGPPQLDHYAELMEASEWIRSLEGPSPP